MTHRSATFLVGWCCVLLAALGSAQDPVGLSEGAKAEVLFDFDRSGLQAVWKEPQGGLQMQFVEGPEAEAGLGPEGNALSISTRARGFLYTRSGQLPGGLPRAEALTFWAHAEKPATVEVQLIEKGGVAKFWRKADFAGTGWQEVVVPLRYMRWSGRRTPDWRGVQHFAIFFRTPAEIAIDNIALAKGGKRTAGVSTEELTQLAFPKVARDSVRTFENADLRVLTNCPKVEFDQLVKLIQHFAAAIRNDLPFLPEKPVRIPTLIVFDTQEQYKEFPARFAAKHNSSGARPTSGGYTFMGIATSFWNPAYGTRRPVYGHEFLHAYLELLWGLPSDSGDWLQEGLASKYQIQIHPQKGFDSIVLEGISKPGHHLPLKKLCSGERIPMNRYWQALTVTRMLLEKEPYREKLKEIFQAFRQAGSDMDPILTKLLKRSWDQFDKDWREFCQETYSAK